MTPLMEARPLRVAVVGGGITGLGAAYRLFERARETGVSLQVSVFEASDRFGGKIRTQTTDDGYVIEAGPDSFLTRKAGVVNLSRKLGLMDRLISTKGQGMGSYVLSRGRLRRLPEGLVLMVPSRLGTLVKTDLLSPRGKLRAMMDLFIPARRGGGDESLESFVTRRLGREVLDRIAEPLIAGIHSAEPATMSLRASFPRMLEMEERHGSLIRAALHGRKNPPPKDASGLSYFMSFQEGMEELPKAVVAALPPQWLQPGSAVQSLERDGDGYLLRVTGKDALPFDGIILALSPQGAGALIQGIRPDVTVALGGFRSISSATTTFAFRRKTVGASLMGHGFVVPRMEGRQIMGATYLSEKWAGRSPDPDTLLIRAFVGGALGQGVIAQGEASVREAALKELKDILNISHEPLFSRTIIYDGGMPQYTLGHLDRVAGVEAQLTSDPGIRLAGAGYHGIGLPDCIESGEAAADAVLKACTGRAA